MGGKAQLNRRKVNLLSIKPIVIETTNLNNIYLIVLVIYISKKVTFLKTALINNLKIELIFTISSVARVNIKRAIVKAIIIIIYISILLLIVRTRSIAYIIRLVILLITVLIIELIITIVKSIRLSTTLALIIERLYPLSILLIPKSIIVLIETKIEYRLIEKRIKYKVVYRRVIKEELRIKEWLKLEINIEIELKGLKLKGLN